MTTKMDIRLLLSLLFHGDEYIPEVLERIALFPLGKKKKKKRQVRIL